MNVSLTGMDRDIDCSVNGLACSNRGGTSDDDWSGELGPGTHTVQVYPYHGGTGAWTITASVNCPAGHFASGGSCHRYVVPERPIDGPVPMTAEGAEVLGCNNDTELPADQECVDGFVVFKDGITVTSTPIPIPPIVTIVIVIPPPPPPPSPPPPPTPPAAEPSGDSLATATSDINCEGWNIDDGDGFDSPRPDGEGGTRPHRAIDIQVSNRDASFFALADGTITNYASSPTCGHQIAVSLAGGGRHVYCHMDRRDRSPAGTEVRAGDRIGSYGPSGVTGGPHLHLKVTDADDRPIDPVEAAGGEDVMAAAGFTFNSSDAEHCAGE